MAHSRWSIVLFLSRRYLFSTKQRFVPLLAGVTFISITLSIFFLLIVLGVMRGFQNELNDRWIGLNAHLTITHLPDTFQKQIEDWPEVEEVQQFAFGEVIVQSHQGEEVSSVAAKLKGFDVLSKAFLKRVQLYPNLPLNWPTIPESKFPPLLGGDELFSALGVSPEYPQKVSVITPLGEIGPTGDFVPKKKEFQPTHVFRTGLYAWDAYTILVPLQAAVSLLGDQAEQGIQIRLKDLGYLEKVEERLKEKFPADVHIESFSQQNAKLFAALKLERVGMTFLLILFLAVASFSMTGLLLMFLYSKQRDLAILRAVGLPPEGAKKIYLALGGLLGGAGSLTGGLLGLIACWLLKHYPIPLPSTYYLDFLPVQLAWPEVVAVSSWYPARLASRMQILPMLREE